MKKLSVLLFAVTLLLALCSVASAGLSYGIKGGLSLASQDFSYDSGLSLDESHRAGLAGGVFVEFDTVAGFSVVTEALYVQRGMELNYTITGAEDPTPTGTMTIDEQVDYICIPVLAKKSFGLGGVDLYLAAGPRFDYLLDYEAGLDLGDIYKGFSDFDIGADAVVGAEAGPLLVEVRYCPTFTKSYDEGALEVTNEGYLLLAGYRF